MLEPLKPVSRGARLALGAAFFVVFFAAWALATFGGAVDAMFLKDPLYTLRTGVNLFREFGFIGDVGITVFRVVGGFVLAALVAVPLGIAMGAFKPIEAFFEPFVSFARYLPASAFIPLLILWAGVGETQKLLVIFIGSVFQVILMVAVIVGSTRRDLVEAAYTLGADAVLVGRPYVFGLAVAGAVGVAHVLQILRAELEVAMALTGCADLQGIGPEVIWRASPR